MDAGRAVAGFRGVEAGQVDADRQVVVGAIVQGPGRPSPQQLLIQPEEQSAQPAPLLYAACRRFNARRATEVAHTSPPHKIIRNHPLSQSKRNTLREDSSTRSSNSEHTLSPNGGKGIKGPG